ncbi:MAG: peptidase [Tabrizicola sp.]|nr:peptidase [Tabrizicola sp.]
MADPTGKYDGPPAARGSETANPVPPAWQDAETFRRSMPARPASWDDATLTFEAVIATETPVARRDRQGGFLEVLSLGGLDLARAQGVPLVDNHRLGSARDVVGIVESVRVEGGEAIARLRLSQADDVAPITARVKDGTLRGVSVGYIVPEWRNGADAQGRRTRTAVRWTICETSLTPNPADENTGIRSNERTSDMPDTTPETVSPEAAELQRRSDIRALFRSANLPPEEADALIDSGADLDAAKAAAWDAQQSRRRSQPVIRVHGGGADDPATIRTRQADALAYRMGGLDKLPEASREFADTSLLDMARASVERAGVSTRGMSRDEILHRSAAHTVSDFPLTVMDAMNKTAMQSYQTAESPVKGLFRKHTVRDFKASTAIRLGEMGQLEELAENGEFTATSRGEEGESIQAKTYGAAARRVPQPDRQRRPQRSRRHDAGLRRGGGADRSGADAGDVSPATRPCGTATAVFDASRGNLGNVGGGAAGAIGSTGVDVFTDARQAMRTAKGTDGKTIVGAAPRFMLVGPEIETLAEQILAETYPTKSDEVNVAASKLTLLVEPRLEGDAVYIFADPARLAALRYVYLAGAEGVQIQRREMWDSLGLSFRAYLDFGAGWLDWRGAYLHEGS